MFPFRPWVGRAGASIVIVAALVTLAMLGALFWLPRARFGWLGEPFAWLYILALWAGGLRVWLGARWPVAEVGESSILLRPLHMFRAKSVSFDDVRGTEMMRRGDRLILYYDTRRGMRFVALNLNLIRGRKDFLALLEQRLAARGFVEKIVGESRYLSPRA